MTPFEALSDINWIYYTGSNERLMGYGTNKANGKVMGLIDGPKIVKIKEILKSLLSKEIENEELTEALLTFDAHCDPLEKSPEIGIHRSSLIFEPTEEHRGH